MRKKLIGLSLAALTLFTSPVLAQDKENTRINPELDLYCKHVGTGIQNVYGMKEAGYDREYITKRLYKLVNDYKLVDLIVEVAYSIPDGIDPKAVQDAGIKSCNTTFAKYFK